MIAYSKKRYLDCWISVSLRTLSTAANVRYPDTFVPSAKLIAVGNDMLLFLANPLTTFSGRKPRRWKGSVETGVFRTISDPYFLRGPPIRQIVEYRAPSHG